MTLMKKITEFLQSNVSSTKGRDSEGTWPRIEAIESRLLMSGDISSLDGSVENVEPDADKALPKLLESAVKGKVYKRVEIHGTV